MKKARFTAGLILALGATTGLSPVTRAQDKVQPGAGIADIIVTAEKRSTSLQKTPVAITALSTDTLRQAQATSLPAIAGLVPSFQMGQANGYAQITMRGIGISNFAPGAESAVAVNANEVYISRAIAQLTGLYDVASLEILRGPQGTLYGRNATAGAVNITTARPTSELSGYGAATIGNYGLMRLEGAVGGPIIADRLLLRLAGFRETRNGYGKNLATGNDVDDKDAWGLRGTVEFRASPNLTATLIYEHFKESDRSAGVHYFGAAGLINRPGALGIPPSFILLGGAPPADIRDVNNPGDPRFRLRTNAVTGILNWSNGRFGLKSITGYRDQSSLTWTDIGGGNLPTPGFQGAAFVAGEPAHQFSEELQAHYDDDHLHLTIGGFLFRESDDYNPATITSASEYLNAAFPGLPQRPAGLLYNIAQIGGLTKTRARAAFVQGTYEIGNGLSLTAGIRFSAERKQLFQRFSFDLYKPFTGDTTPPPAVAIPAKTFRSTTPKLGIQYQVSPRTLIYGSYSKGFKSGGFDPGTAPSLVGDGFRPEKLTDYEGGIKTTLLDNRLRLNISGFYYDYTDLQVLQLRGANQLVTSNAGTAKAYGVEMEVTAAITPEFSIDMNGSWLHARYGHFVGADNALPLLPAIDFSGNRLNNAPDFSAHLGASYRRTVGSGTVTLHADGDYSSRFYFTPANISALGQSAFVKLNASVGYDDNAGWVVKAFIRNITDRTTKGSTFVNSLLFGTAIEGALAPPRTFGAEIGYKF